MLHGICIVRKRLRSFVVVLCECVLVKLSFSTSPLVGGGSDRNRRFTCSKAHTGTHDE